jgi:hypothetical protein
MASNRPERAKMKNPKTLKALFTMMKNNDLSLPEWDSLPLFNETTTNIVDTSEVWSWDDTHKIVGTCPHDIKIVERDDI